ncbi:HEAT repeat domain-containing protein [Geobacter pickeringii]|nr:HEAT repeat domain-containing protein [Geobacter pickeringii]
MPLAISLLWVITAGTLSHLRLVEIVAEDLNVAFNIGAYILTFAICFYAWLVPVTFFLWIFERQLSILTINGIIAADLLVLVLFSIFPGEGAGFFRLNNRDIMLIPAVYTQFFIMKAGLIREGRIPDTRPTATLIQALHAPDPEIRRNAIKSISARRDPAAVEALTATLRDEDFCVRGRAVEALGRINDRRVVTVLVDAWKHGDGTMKSSVEGALLHIEIPGAADELINLLHDKEAHRLHGAAAKALGDIGDRRAVEPLIRALDGPGRDLHMVKTLAKLGNPRAVEPLLGLLRKSRSNETFDANNYLNESIEALGDLKDRRATGDLVPLLKKGNWYVKGITARALGKIGDTGAVEPLIDGLCDKEENLRKNAAIALAEIRDDRAIAPLVTVLNKSDDTSLREAAAWALGKFGNQRVIAPLVATLKSDKSIDVRRQAAYALGKCNSSEAIAPLVESLKRDGRDVRMASAHSLGAFHQSSAIESLIAAQSDRDSSVQWEATLSLDRLPGNEAAAAVENFARRFDIAGIAKNYEKIIRKGDVRKKYPLIFALSRYGNEQMAKDFVTSGHGLLEDTGRKWLKSHGFPQDPSPRPGAPEWDKQPEPD